MFLTGFEEGLNHNRCYKSLFAPYFLMRQNNICVQNPGKGETAFSRSCEKSQATAEQEPSLPFQEGNIQSVKTQVSFAAAKTSAS